MPKQNQLTLELGGQKMLGPCDCCGQTTSRVWGYVYDLEIAIAAYFVEWTLGHKDVSAAFDLIIGKWGEHTYSSDRQAISLEFRNLKSGPEFMVVNASSRPVANSTLISQTLDRDKVIGTPIANHVFAICDLIYLEDPRLSDLRH